MITARVGTPLVTIEAALESAGQMLPCEPPHYGEEATWGGMVACGLAGPRRPWSGSVRDLSSARASLPALENICVLVAK